MAAGAKQVAGLAALERRRGMDESKARVLTAHFEAQSDLYTQCPKCKKRIQGTMAELKAHTCGQ